MAAIISSTFPPREELVATVCLRTDNGGFRSAPRCRGVCTHSHCHPSAPAGSCLRISTTLYLWKSAEHLINTGSVWEHQRQVTPFFVRYLLDWRTHTHVDDGEYRVEVRGDLRSESNEYGDDDDQQKRDHIGIITKEWRPLKWERLIADARVSQEQPKHDLDPADSLNSSVGYDVSK